MSKIISVSGPDAPSVKRVNAAFKQFAVQVDKFLAVCYAEGHSIKNIRVQVTEGSRRLRLQYAKTK
jgi:hypothetical protein